MPLEVGLLFKMPYSKSMILHFTEYWKIIVFPPSFCMCSLQYLRGIWILTWNLVIWDTLWAAQSFPVNWLPVPSFHQGYSGRGAHDAAREIGGIREYGEAQVQKMYRNVFKTWCPPALMRILMTTDLPPHVNNCAMDRDEVGKMQEGDLISLHLADSFCFSSGLTHFQQFREEFEWWIFHLTLYILK